MTINQNLKKKIDFLFTNTLNLTSNQNCFSPTLARGSSTKYGLSGNVAGDIASIILDTAPGLITRPDSIFNFPG